MLLFRAFMLLCIICNGTNLNSFMVRKEIYTKEVGKKIREIRSSKNVSIEALANQSDMTYSQVSRIELGKINTSVYTLFILSKSLEVHPGEFLKVNCS